MFRQEKVNDGIHKVCQLFDQEDYTLAERWYICLSVERAAEGIMANGIEEAAEQLRKFKEGVK